MPDPQFSYTPLAHELADALRHVVNAQDYALGAGEAAVLSPTERDRQERGQLLGALARLKNAVGALVARRDEVAGRLALAEADATAAARPTLDRLAARVERDIADLPERER